MEANQESQLNQAQETSLVDKQSSDQQMTNSNEVGGSEEQSSIQSRSLGSGDIGGNAGPDNLAAAKPSSPVNQNMNSAPTLQVDPMGMNIISSGASAQFINKNVDIQMSDQSPRENSLGATSSAVNIKNHENMVAFSRGSGGGSSKNGDLDRQIALLKTCECIKESEVRDLCNMARDILLEESNIQNISSPITICGDIHGQFYDLMELFKVGGDCPKTNYIFMGDFVDRGFHSVETFLLLLALKVRYKDRITLIRGNHESRQITQVYGFYDECLRKYGSVNVWRYCTEIFDFLPLAAIIDDRIFCVHGGLSPSFNTLDEIKTIDRKQEVPHDGAMCDLMWSDPEEINGWSMSPRGAGYLFGGDVVAEFCMTNNVTQIARAHQLVMDGYKKMFNDTLVTVWSAPNYCYRCGNVAAILQLDENLQPEYKKFEAASNETRGVPAKKPAPEYFL